MRKFLHSKSLQPENTVIFTTENTKYQKKRKNPQLKVKRQQQPKKQQCSKIQSIFSFTNESIATVRTNGSQLHETKQIKCKRKM